MEYYFTAQKLAVGYDNRPLIENIDFSLKRGEILTLIGPNGAGKSTLASVLTGNQAFNVTKGDVTFYGKNLLELSPEDRSREVIFLSFQYPVEIPGVSMVNFMRTALNEHRKYKNLEPLSATDFLRRLRGRQ